MNRTRPIQELDPESIFRDWLQEFEAILLRRDGEALARLCGDESYFKDILALEWNFRTHSGPGEIQRALHDGIDSRNFRDFHIAPNRTATGFGPARRTRSARGLVFPSAPISASATALCGWSMAMVTRLRRRYGRCCLR